MKEILRDVKTLAVEYHEATGEPLSVTGEIAEFEAAEKLGLQLAEARSPGWDAVRPGDSTKIQINGRWERDSKAWGRVSKFDTMKEFASSVMSSTSCYALIMGPSFRCIWCRERL